MPHVGPLSMIGDNPGPRPSGSAFLLVSRPPKGHRIQLGGGEIEVHDASPYVVARFDSASDALTAFSEGHLLAQRGLDMLSVLGLSDLVIRDSEDDHLVWWTEPSGLVLRSVSTTLLRFSVGEVTLTVRDKEGNVVPPAPSQPRHHIAFRFFRLAQTTDDLFDAYRNMYLAFEVLLSTQYPKPATEREIDWLHRGLDSSSQILHLDALGLPPHPDVARAILDKVYVDARLPLFHAKEGHPYFAPHDDPTSRRAVAEALGLLTNIVLRMAEAWFGARRPGGGVFFGWVYENVQHILANCCAYASNYDGDFDATEKDLTHPRFATAARLECRPAPELQRGREPSVISVATADELIKANPLRRVELASDTQPFAAHILDAPIHLEGVHRFEDLMHIRGTNTNQPRSLFRQ